MWDEYFYEKNLQGDIVAVYNASGTKLISYTYDAWGNFTTSYHNSGASTTAVNNPITYRSYYYDSDLGFYYLQSRYYDPNTYRFINADGYVSTGQGLTGYNMFAYCGNNPIMYVDPIGEFPWFAVIILVTSTIIGGILGANYTSEKDSDTESSDNSSDNSIENGTEGEPNSGAEKAKNITIGAALGLMVGGTIVIIGGTSASLFLVPETAKNLLGATALQTVALGTLAFNVGAVILPAFGIEIDAIDEFPKPMK